MVNYLQKILNDMPSKRGMMGTGNSYNNPCWLFDELDDEMSERCLSYVLFGIIVTYYIASSHIT